MEKKKLFDEFDNCLNTSAVTGSSDKEDRGDLLIVLGEFVKTLLEECTVTDASIMFNSNKRIVDAYSESNNTLYQLGIMLKSYSLFLDITPSVMPDMAVRKILKDSHGCSINDKSIRKGWSMEAEATEIYKEARQIICSLQ